MTALIKFGQVREIPQEAIDTREVEFVISDESKDRHNTILKADGWELDNYNKNSIVGYQHNVYGGGMCSGPDPDMVIGKGHARIEGVETIGKVFFEPADINPLAEKIFRKVLFGSLRSTSVGFSEITKGTYGEGDQAKGAPQETFYFGKRELLEFSVVNIPSNRNAQVRAMRDQTQGALAYVSRELGDKFRLSQIEQMRVCDVLDLLEGKDVEIRSVDPDEVRRLLADIEQRDRRIATLETKIKYYKLGK
jgi:hypothetical protein